MRLQPDAPSLLADRTSREVLLAELAYRKRQGLEFLRAGLRRGSRSHPLLVLTTSRSGSTWFCELLARIHRRGQLPEHLRPQHFQFAKHQSNGLLSMQSWVQETARRVACGREAGTKLIWDDFPDLEDSGASIAIRQALKPLLSMAPVCLRLRRRDQAAQAVSRYWSASTGVYHRVRVRNRFHRTTTSQSARPVRVTPTYDALQIRHHEEVLQRAETHLDDFIAALDTPVLEVEYEQLIIEPVAALLPVAACLMPRASNTARERRIHRALTRSVLMPGGDRAQAAWVDRYLQESAS